jgi:DNA-binding transcriptional MerR regulator
VSARTIRLYEGLGILPVPDRSPGGTRRYNREYQFYIEGALLLKDLGFSLEEVKLVGRLARHAPMTSAERRCARQAIAAKMTSLDHRIRVLQRLRDVLPMASRDGDCLATLVSIAGRAEITR